MRIYRLLGLLSVLAEVEHITVQELAVRFEVSRRTILRDIDTLNEAGFPCCLPAGERGRSLHPEGIPARQKTAFQGGYR